MPIWQIPYFFTDIIPQNVDVVVVLFFLLLERGIFVWMELYKRVGKTFDNELKERKKKKKKEQQMKGWLSSSPDENL